MRPNVITREIIGAAIEVHRALGPGKPEPAYEAALARELGLRGISNCVQKPVPVVYKGVRLDCGYRLDLLTEDAVVVEIKSVELIHPVNRAQVLTYLKLGGWKLALLLNFNVAVLKDGIERLVLGFDEDGAGGQTASTGNITNSKSATSPFLHSEMHSGDDTAEDIAEQIILCAMEVHRELGPGLLRSAYEACLRHEMGLRGLAFERKQPLPLSYKGLLLPALDEVELLVGGRVVVHPLALFAIESLHVSALLSQLRLGQWNLGLLLNFNTIGLGEGIRRVVLNRGD
jgi:GxxExxY protein